MGLDESGGVGQEQEQEQPDGEPDAEGQGFDGAGRTFAVFQQIIERRAETADDNQENEDDDDFQEGSAMFVEGVRNRRGRRREGR